MGAESVQLSQRQSLSPVVGPWVVSTKRYLRAGIGTPPFLTWVTYRVGMAPISQYLFSLRVYPAASTMGCVWSSLRHRRSRLCGPCLISLHVAGAFETPGSDPSDRRWWQGQPLICGRVRCYNNSLGMPTMRSHRQHSTHVEPGTHLLAPELLHACENSWRMGGSPAHEGQREPWRHSRC